MHDDEEMRAKRAAMTAALATDSPGGTPEWISTHGHHVALGGSRVLKLKRPVKYPFLDYSTPPLRKTACEAELALGQRFAPALYRGLLPLTRSDTGFVVDGPGEAVDWVLDLRLFAPETQFDRLLEADALPPPLIDAMADCIADLHAKAPERPDRFTTDITRQTLEGIHETMANTPSGMLDPSRREAFITASTRALIKAQPHIQRRRSEGHVRHCHGDMHLRNWCLLDGAPTPFDAIEFDDHIACVDILYDLAFPLMDLVFRGRPDLANRLLNRYLETTQSYNSLDLLPMYVSWRASVRAMVTALEHQNGTPHLALANRLLESLPAPRLVLVGGLSGSGKSTLARALAPTLGGPLGAIWLRSDGLRKRLWGVTPETPLPQEAYTAAISTRVFDQLTQSARMAWRCGMSVVCDATFLNPRHRDALMHAATADAVPVTGLWVSAPAPLTENRLATRTGDASDAGIAVYHSQQRAASAAPAEWHRLINDSSPAALLVQAQAALGGPYD